MPKKRSEFVNHLNGLLEKIEKQSLLAKLIGVSDSRIPEWMAGKRLPSPDTLIKLGKLAVDRGLPDPFFFWALAGVDTQTLRLMADKVQERQYELVGDTVPVSRFRETAQGREEAGPPIPLPAEFIPNPDSTICIVVSQIDFGIAFGPRGLFVVDESLKDVDVLSPLWERVVLLDYPSAIGLYPGGFYVGRLHIESRGARPGSGVPLDTRYLVWHGRLRSVDTPAQYQSIHFGEWRHPLFEKYTVAQPNENWRPREVLPSEIEEFEAACREAEERAPKEFRLPKGVRILGKVIGRLTGHLK